MAICIRKNNLIDRLILNIMVLEIIAFRWFDIMGITSAVLLVLVCLAFVKYNYLYGDIYGFVIVGLILLYNIASFYFFRGSFSIWIANTFRITKAFAIMAYISRLYVYERSILISFIREKILLLNAFLILNIPITILQIYRPGFLVGVRKYNFHDFNPDFVSGLFGMYGTPCMGMYFCFIFVLNYAYLRNGQIRRRLNFIILNFAIAVFYFALFIINDNKGAYFIFVMTTFLVFLAVSNRDLQFKGEFSRFIYNFGFFVKAAILVVFIVMLLNTFSGIHEVFIKVVKMLEDAVKSTTYKSYGGAQRISIILQAVRGKRSLFGYGLGNIVFKNRMAFGYDNFGLADLGVFLIQGGVAYVVLWMMLMTSIFKSVFNSLFMAISVMGFIMVCAFYTQIFVDTSTFCSSMFLIIGLELIYNGNKS